MKMHSTGFPAFMVMTLALTACATGPRIHSLYDPATDFGGFATYNFAPEAKAGDEPYTTFLTRYIRQAVSRELENRGYRLAESPDLLVNFKVQTREKFDVREVPAMGRPPFYRRYPYYYSYRFGFYEPWPYYAYETRMVQYTEGTLNIDLINAAAKQLVWEGIAIGRVHASDRVHLQQSVNEAAASIFPIRRLTVV
jgi:hypothetical protein